MSATTASGANPCTAGAAPTPRSAHGRLRRRTFAAREGGIAGGAGKQADKRGGARVVASATVVSEVVVVGDDGGEVVVAVDVMAASATALSQNNASPRDAEGTLTWPR